MPPEKETDPARGFAEELLTPQFWQCQKEKRPLCLQGVGQGLLAKVGTDEILEALCKGTRPRLGTTFAHLRGEPHLRENVFLAYLDQATLSLNSAEHFLPWLLKACQALEAAFAFVSARLVIDPEHQKIPTSESDLLVLQLLGEEPLSDSLSLLFSVFLQYMSSSLDVTGRCLAVASDLVVSSSRSSSR